MDHVISGYNGFDIIAFELGITPEALMLGVEKESENILHRVSESPLSRLKLVLSEDMRLAGTEMPFITTGKNFLSYIEPVFKRLCKNPDVFSPPVIEPTPEINAHLRKKILDRFSAVTRRLAASERFGRIYSQFEKERDLQLIVKDFQDGIEHYMTTPTVIDDILSSIRHPKRSSVLENCVNGAFIAIAVLHNYEGFDLSGDECRSAMVELGLSMLFQDLACLSDADNIKHDASDHCNVSLERGAALGLPERTLETIRHHHRVMDAHGRPFYAMNTAPLFERIAVVVNNFVSCILPDSYDLTVPQAIFVLRHFAVKSYLDSAAVRSLGKISVGERKGAIIDMYFDIAKQCPKRVIPYIWDINTPVPNRLICSEAQCEHAAAESVKLYHTISFEMGDQKFNLPEGTYHKCRKLTRQLNVWLLTTGRYKK